ncbi:PL29 family lyase N-terminal domain-containing protein [Alistipes senegalensis]|uniref:PL29 family lyase N-terminal domain-containing protein n=1 Tax=Alistipes senegalensis JC50 TaxID=1033732 RepID=A0ABY5V2S3_9BACT|nr:PL29 family lyase N-terminal domain-containing protein [Alistipes senegalensis]UEA88518.1 leucine-rich repeat protein [Alistipes senegalensis]UWN63890.1 PL29 family lyase N-terminal domain-containing protein [Alistipes senegalensis JC50]
MKKLLTFAALLAVVAFTSCKYDDDDIWNSVHGLENRVAKLEELCKQMNTNISSLQTIVTALQNNDYVTGITPVMQGGKEVGYTITFSKSNPITIYHGKDGQNGEDGTDGKDGVTPTIGVKQDTDGIYYWTLDGDWLTDKHGDKIKAEGKDGADGSDGEDGSDGTDGTNGKDGITPQFKIENDYWFISYDNGNTWTQLGKATGENGKDGEDGVGGDSMFTGIDYKTSTDYVIFTLADGTQIKLPTWSAFEALQRLCNETNTNLSALQTIVTALQNNDYITSVDPLTEDGKVVGYTIKFAKSNPIVIYNGKDDTDGVDGNTPIIGVKKDTDDIYYWTLDGEFIVVDGQKIKAQGTDGNNGVDGSDGVTPKLEIRESYWWISYDNGTNWTQLGKATGENGADGKDGDSIKITQDENNVYFELVDGTIITISKTGSQSSNIIIFADKDVKKRCVGLWDTNGDGELSHEEVAAVTTIGTVFQNNTDIEFFNELKYFSGLTALEANAFNGCSNLCNIAIPANVATIDVSSFKGCSQLMQVTFDKNSCITIFEGSYNENGGSYNGVFADCRALKTIRIPASVTEIKACAFQNCTSLSSVTFEDDSNLQTIGGGYTCYRGNYDSYDFGIFGAFAGCTSLTSIEIPNSVKEIGVCAFQGCSQLQSVTFQKGSLITTLSGGYISKGYGTSIENASNMIFGVFAKCSTLSSIEIPANVETIDACVFQDCINLSVVTFEQGSKLKEFGDGYAKTGYRPFVTGAFANCTALESIQIPANVEKIGVGTFKNCSQLSSVTFEPDSKLKTIGGYCDGNWSSEVGTKHYGAFADCEALTNIELPASLTAINSVAFSNCRKLIDVYCTALTPPTIKTGSSGTFTNISSAARFYVPLESVDAYKAATGWEKYANQIVGYNFTE